MWLNKAGHRKPVFAAMISLLVKRRALTPREKVHIRGFLPVYDYITSDNSLADALSRDPETKRVEADGRTSKVQDRDFQPALKALKRELVLAKRARHRRHV